MNSKKDVDDLTAQIEKNGYKIGSYPRITGDGFYESSIIDPEGNIIELIYDTP